MPLTGERSSGWLRLSFAYIQPKSLKSTPRCGFVEPLGLFVSPYGLVTLGDTPLIGHNMRCIISRHDIFISVLGCKTSNKVLE